MIWDTTSSPAALITLTLFLEAVWGKERNKKKRGLGGGNDYYNSCLGKD